MFRFFKDFDFLSNLYTRSNLQPRDQGSHALPTELARCPETFCFRDAPVGEHSPSPAVALGDTSPAEGSGLDWAGAARPPPKDPTEPHATA